MFVVNIMAIYLKIKQNCCICFRKQSANQNQFQQELLQIHTKNQQIIQEFDQKNQIQNQNRTKQQQKKICQNYQQQSPLKEEEFHSMQSFFSRQSLRRCSTKNRKSFNILLNKGLLGQRIKNDEFKQITNQFQQEEDSVQLSPDRKMSLKLITYIQKLKEWMKNEYFNSQKETNFTLSFATRLRMQGSTMMNNLIHKLDDYKLFYMQDQSNLGLLRYTNKNKTFLANYTKYSLLQQSIHNSSQYKCYYKINCNTMNISKILKWVNSSQTLRIMHHFYNISIIKDEELGRDDFPLLQIQQYDSKLKGKNIYHMHKQILQIEFEGDEGLFLVQVDFTLDEGDSPFQRIVKLHISQKGSIEIYTESSENIIINDDRYFKQKWYKIEEYLSNLQFLNPIIVLNQ